LRNGGEEVIVRKENEGLRARYIATLRDAESSEEEIQNVAQDLAVRLGGKVVYNYFGVLPAFAIEIPIAQVDSLRADERVALVSQDQAVHLVSRWGLDRIFQQYPCSTPNPVPVHGGKGVDIYVLDTGITNLSNIFGVRLQMGYSVIGGGTNDQNGHGTEVAALAAGEAVGVARSATLIPVRVQADQFNGKVTDLIAGITWTTNVASKSSAPAIALISLATGRYPLLDLAVSNSIQTGISYIVAAGNDRRDASGTSPAGAAGAITVGALMPLDCQRDQIWVSGNEGSNFGSLVELFAPGSAVDTFDQYGTVQAISGTSPAAGFVAGIAALFLERQPKSNPYQVAQGLIAAAATGLIDKLPPGTPNRVASALLMETFLAKSLRWARRIFRFQRPRRQAA
jgi:hypothetical protein